MLKKAEILKLTQIESIDIFGIKEIDPDDHEIDNILSFMKDYLRDASVYSILIDNRGSILACSEGFYHLLPLDKVEITNFLGTNLIEILFNEDLPFQKILGIDDSMAIFEIILFLHNNKGREEESWFKEILKKLSKFERFNMLLKEAHNNENTYISAQSRKVKIKVEGDVYHFISNFYKLNIDPRFELIDYVLLD